MRVKRFSSQQEPIDISHLSPAAQKEIIRRERKKIELDQKISDTHDSLMKSRSRAGMSLEDNAKLGAYEMKKNPVASFGSAVGGSVLGGKIAKTATTVASKFIPGMGEGASEALYVGARMAGSSLAPAITEGVGKAVGTVRGLTAESAARRKEKKLRRLLKKREQLGE